MAKGRDACLLPNFQVAPATKIPFIDLSRIATRQKGRKMNSIIYLVGLVVVVLAILSFFGLS